MYPPVWETIIHGVREMAITEREGGERYIGRLRLRERERGEKERERERERREREREKARLREGD